MIPIMIKGLYETTRELQTWTYLGCRTLGTIERNTWTRMRDNLNLTLLICNIWNLQYCRACTCETYHLHLLSFSQPKIKKIFFTIILFTGYSVKWWRYKRLKRKYALGPLIHITQFFLNTISIEAGKCE